MGRHANYNFPSTRGLMDVSEIDSSFKSYIPRENKTIDVLVWGMLIIASVNVGLLLGMSLFYVSL